MWVARVTGIAVARRPRAYPLAFGPGSVAVVRGRGGRCGPGATGFNLVRFRVYLEPNLGTRGSPRWIILISNPHDPWVRGLPLPEPDTLWLVHTPKKQEQDHRRPGPTTPQRRTATHHAQTANHPACSRARACYPGGLQLASTTPTHRNRTLSATSMFITAAVSSCVGAPLAPCGALEDPFTSTLVC